jgi:RimJ/RimL family protein N-acetyltransferase
MERRADGEFLGFCGLERIALSGSPIDGEVEIGWRLREDAWGQGFAREVAEASLDWGFDNLDVDRIVAITVPANVRSRGLMLRLGMTHRPALDFGHPAFAGGHPLHAHVTYAIDRPA